MSTGLATPILKISRGVDDRGDQQVYPYSFLRTRVEQWTSCLHLCSFSTYVYGEARLSPSSYHQLLYLAVEHHNHLFSSLAHQCPALAQDLHPGANIFALASI